MGIGFVFGRVGGFGGFVVVLLAQRHQRQPPLPQAVDTFVNDNALQPGPEGGVALVAAQLAKGTQKRLLKHILGLGVVAGDAQGRVEHSLGVAPVDFGLGLAVIQAAALHQRGVDVDVGGKGKGFHAENGGLRSA